MSNRFLHSLCGFAPLRLCVKFLAFAFSAASSRTPTAAAQPYARGGIDRANRGICVISAALAEPAASQMCQFGGFRRASRLSFQRK